MDIHKIIYDTTRQLMTVEEKLRISTIFLFCHSSGTLEFSELLYTDSPEKYINNLNDSYKYWHIDLKIDFSNKNVKNSFELTRKAIIEKHDKDGYYKAVYKKDPFALVIAEIANTSFDIQSFSKKVTAINEQLKLF